MRERAIACGELLMLLVFTWTVVATEVLREIRPTDDRTVNTFIVQAVVVFVRTTDVSSHLDSESTDSATKIESNLDD